MLYLYRHPSMDIDNFNKKSLKILVFVARIFARPFPANIVVALSLVLSVLSQILLCFSRYYSSFRHPGMMVFFLRSVVDFGRVFVLRRPAWCFGPPMVRMALFIMRG